jgi:hypothetical protein
MKRLFLVLLLVVMASAMALAQVTAGGTKMTTGSSSTVAPAIDILGAHNNYGRGCAGCHAPHSGAYGAGGNAVTGTVTDSYTGTNALFAQDMGPLWGQTFDFSDISNTGSANKYLLTTPTSGSPTSWTAQQYSDVRGIIMCLACHDGAVAKGAMMQNWAFEEQIGALPTSYGSGKIPTLLGNDGTSAGNYNNDHPVGESATMSAVLGSYYNNASNGLTYTITNNAITSFVAAGQYAQFVTSYGTPAIGKGAHSYGTPVNASGVPYLVCTTCHNQHAMNVYASSATTPIAKNTAGTYATFFFINGPYNVNDVTLHPTSANSTTQFCRQCHFGESNEANGGTLPTVF